MLNKWLCWLQRSRTLLTGWSLKVQQSWPLCNSTITYAKQNEEKCQPFRTNWTLVSNKQKAMHMQKIAISMKHFNIRSSKKKQTNIFSLKHKQTSFSIKSCLQNNLKELQQTEHLSAHTRTSHIFSTTNTPNTTHSKIFKLHLQNILVYTYKWYKINVTILYLDIKNNSFGRQASHTKFP